MQSPFCSFWSHPKREILSSQFLWSSTPFFSSPSYFTDEMALFHMPYCSMHSGIHVRWSILLFICNVKLLSHIGIQTQQNCSTSSRSSIIGSIQRPHHLKTKLLFVSFPINIQGTIGMSVTPLLLRNHSVNTPSQWRCNCFTLFLNLC